MIILAPLHGFTDFIFRNVYARHFTGIDMAVSPFISLTHSSKVNPRKAKDVLPANNLSIPVIPQILGNQPDLFIQMCQFLDGWGYEEINWNLGCPVKSIANKKRGSGLLPHPELLRSILEQIVPEIKQKLSIKLRLGYSDKDEINRIIPVLNDFPLKNITIHPRIGIQMYEGEIIHQGLNDIINSINHEVIYNGDIVDLKSYNEAKLKYPSIKSWMIGRGIYYNPWLAEEIKCGLETDKTNQRIKLLDFFCDLYQELLKHKGETQTINKIKDLWQLFCFIFGNHQKVINQISHAVSLAEIEEITIRVIETVSVTKQNAVR